jgi:uncharacterized protein YqgV (UPF0045/DUF77 family)
MTAPTEPVKTPMKCPHCASEFHVENVARYLDNSEISVHLTPHSGTLMDSDDLGSVITNFGKLQKAVAKEMGAHVKCFVVGLGIKEDGTISVRFKIARIVKEKTR